MIKTKADETQISHWEDLDGSRWEATTFGHHHPVRNPLAAIVKAQGSGTRQGLTIVWDLPQRQRYLEAAPARELIQPALMSRRPG